MSKTITSDILVAYSQCPRKAFLLLCTDKHGTSHEYTEILEQQRQTHQRKYLDILQLKNTDVQPYSLENLKGKHDFLINATLEANGLAAECAILNKVRTHSSLGRYSYEPTIFVSAHSIKKEHKLALFFVSHVLEQVQDKRPVSGRIIGLDKSHKVKLENGPKTLIPFLEPVQEWATASSPEPPPLILNKHCSLCQFQSQCRTKAEQEDNLSLLDGISTRKAINKYKKGLFTVKQLSYTFKPRKRKKRAKNPPPVTHKPELQALAIREGKIYLQQLPELIRQPVELFLDIEGVPDQQFYYLIGLLVSDNDTTVYYPFWADTPEDEDQTWQQFLAKVGHYPDAPIYHYGSFEPRALAKLAKRYDTDGDSLTKRLVNVNKHIYGKIYFPVYSNRLKEIGAFIGATWTSPDASGLQSLVWRHHWEESRSTEYKDLLLTYNQEDCRALKLLTDELSKIQHSADTISEVDFADQPKRRATEVGRELHKQFGAILKLAHADYDRKKISLNQIEEKTKGDEKRKRGAKKGHVGYRKMVAKVDETIQIPRLAECPVHIGEPLEESARTVEVIVVDLTFVRSGIEKTTVKYVGERSYCQKCHKYYNPPGVEPHNVVYGHGLRTWIVYHRLFLRLPYRVITEALIDQFSEKISEAAIVNFLRYFGNYYLETELQLIQRLLKSPYIHADETKINIQGTEQYVWVFTDGQHVVFKLTETREATMLYEFLAEYNGVLISDFYPGYDSVQSKQQKCWVHLIRDINDDLWKCPFDTEFEEFALSVRNLIVPILDTVNQHGLSKNYFNKFGSAVEHFYDDVVIKNYKSELALKYQKRFLRYKESLFTFLEYDEVSWNNNMAERALRHLAIQRKISGSFFETIIPHYLLLLGIMQTCRFQNKSLLKFLLSREKDIDTFESTG